MALNPLVPAPTEATFVVGQLVNLVLVLVALPVVVRERRPVPWFALELVAVVLLPLLGPAAVLLVRRTRRPAPPA